MSAAADDAADAARELAISRESAPATLDAWERLKVSTPDELRSFGLVRWEHPDANGFRPLWLFPMAWFYVIPRGLEVSDITGQTGAWDPGAASREQRAGCMGYGFKIKHTRDER